MRRNREFEPKNEEFEPGIVQSEFADDVFGRGRVMAKRTKRTTARKVKAHRKRPKRAKTAKRQAVKRLVKAKRKRQKSKAKPKRSVAKKSASRRPMTPTQPSPLQTETTIVDVIEEPVPGVVVVTEFEETHTRRPDTTRQLGSDQTAGRPESEEE